MTPIGYTTTRMIFGTIIFWVIGLFFQAEKVAPKDLLVMFVGGLFGFLGTQFLFSKSLENTSPVTFSLLMAVTPVLVFLLSALFLNEGLKRRKLLGVVISITGAGLIILSGQQGFDLHSNDGLGIILAVSCAILYAIYMVLTKTISVKYQPVTVAKWMLLFSAISVLPFGYNEVFSQQVFTSGITSAGVPLLLFALVFSTIIAFFLMPFALKRLPAGTVSVFMNIQPILASAVAIFIGQDIFSWDKLLAASLVLMGVYLVSKRG